MKQNKRTIELEERLQEVEMSKEIDLYGDSDR